MPPFPLEMERIWSVFWRLRRRKGGEHGPAPVEWTDIDAFCRRTGTRLDRFETEMIEMLDDLYLAAG